ncbi:hypothetical protein EZV62_019469 [Acer yangbiense]|uniref:ASCH domain-containing protein n=1 Tax=Acer yangbiense TaxID=1000413 RepID=A0A5C7HAE5_9ROSI|nr:hypothetical protein EZV62_019469 [Acer yangbiense]
MRGVRKKDKLTNPCLTMHQPWASLLVCGIKRIEGRSWPTPVTGRLWIHAASKIPEEATIKAMEDFYREIYAVNGVTDLNFPQHYPVSRLLGCVEVVGCVRCEELTSWEALPEGVRLEGQTDFCWLCENPQKLLVPFEMRGYQGVYNLEKKIYESAVRGLTPVKGPLPVKFPLPDARDPFSLKPGSIFVHLSENKSPTVEKSSTLSAAIAGARAAATQFNKKNQDIQTDSMQNGRPDSFAIGRSEKKTLEDNGFNEGTSASAKKEQICRINNVESSSRDQRHAELKQHPGPTPNLGSTYEWVVTKKTGRSSESDLVAFTERESSKSPNEEKILSKEFEHPIFQFNSNLTAWAGTGFQLRIGKAYVI